MKGFIKVLSEYEGQVGQPQGYKNTSVIDKESFKSLYFKQINTSWAGGNTNGICRMLESNPNVLQIN